MKTRTLSRVSGVMPAFLLILLLGDLLVSSGASLPSVSYAARRDFPLQHTPSAIAQGDFNKDGIADVVIANGPAGNVSVILGNSNGTLQSPVNYPAGTSPVSVAVADVNNDGDLDIIVANQGATAGTSTISVLLGNGNGTFQSQIVTTLPSNISIQPLLPFVVGDFTSNGKLDLAFIVQLPQATQEGVAVLLGNGNGSFTTPPQVTMIAAGSAANTDGFGAGDFNGDGKLDLAFTSINQDTLSVLLGKGDGTFGSPIVTPVQSDYYTVGALVVGDFNGDGKADVAIASAEETPELIVFLGKGDGTFQAPLLQASVAPIAATLSVADLNGDGVPDLVLSSTQSPVAAAFLGKGDGTFSQTATFGLSGESVDPNFVGTVEGDFNGDGKVDIVSATPFQNSSLGITSLVLGNGDGTFQVAPTFGPPEGFGPAGYVASADFNKDGVPDLALLSTDLEQGEGFVAILLGNGNGTFGTAVSPSCMAAGPGAPPFVIADFNKDGNPDIAAIQAIAEIGVCLGNGNGTFQTQANYQPGGVGGANSIAAADFNGDGNLDLLTSNNGVGQQGLSVLLGNGDGTFQFAKFTSTVDLPGAVVTGDFNNDGKQDVASVVLINNGSDVGALEVFPGNGDGTFGAAIDTAVSAPAGLNFQGNLAAGDFNGDGNLDVALLATVPTFASPITCQVAIFIGNGNGTFKAPVFYPVGFSPQWVAAADVNGDAILDLVVTNSASSNVSILLGNGDGTFQTTPFNWGTETTPEAVAIADFDGDGAAQQDLAVADESGVSLLLKQLPTTSINLAPNQLSFGDQFVGMASAPQSVTVTNNGKSALNIYAMAITGMEANQFSETNNCPATLAVAATCTVNVTFTPASPSTGVESAALTVTDNVLSSPQMVPLSGEAFDFALTATSSSATVTAGRTATYMLNFSPEGAAGNSTVAFSCSGAPAGATCSVSPGSATLNASAQLTVTVQTAASSLNIPTLIRPPIPPQSHRLAWPLALLSFVSMVLWLLGRRRRTLRRAFAFSAVALVLLLGLVACGGGGGGGSGGGGSGGTPAGTYNLTVTATDGSFSSSITLKLTVN